MLDGRTVLVVEEEFLIALDLQRMLEALDAGQMVFARSPAEAMAAAVHWKDSAVALIEWRPEEGECVSLLEALEITGIPVVFVATHANVQAPPDGRPVVSKPVRELALASAIETALANARQNV